MFEIKCSECHSTDVSIVGTAIMFGSDIKVGFICCYCGRSKEVEAKCVHINHFLNLDPPEDKKETEDECMDRLKKEKFGNNETLPVGKLKKLKKEEKITPYGWCNTGRRREWTDSRKKEFENKETLTVGKGEIEFKDDKILVVGKPQTLGEILMEDLKKLEEENRMIIYIDGTIFADKEDGQTIKDEKGNLVEEDLLIGKTIKSIVKEYWPMGWGYRITLE